jgi:hypothetical protein
MRLFEDHPEVWCSGVEAGLAGTPESCPYPIGSMQAWSWYYGLAEGQNLAAAAREGYRIGTFTSAWRKGLAGGLAGMSLRCPYRRGSLQERAWQSGVGSGQARRAQAIASKRPTDDNGRPKR